MKKHPENLFYTDNYLIIGLPDDGRELDQIVPLTTTGRITKTGRFFKKEF